VAFTGWLNARPLVLEILRKAYNILPLITVFTLVYLLAFKHYEKLKEFLFVFSLTVIATLITGTFLPAVGAFEYNNPPSELLTNIPVMSGRYYLPHLYALREGSMTVIPLDHLTGLIQFTSFHTTMALILTWAMRRTPLFWPFVIINTLMAASTPLYGGHYLMDLIGGTVFAILAILVYAASFKHMQIPQVLTRTQKASLPEASQI
jgi:membrane-associated phospholipid phosphatase